MVGSRKRWGRKQAGAIGEHPNRRARGGDTFLEKSSQNFWGKKGSVGAGGKCDRLLAGKDRGRREWRARAWQMVCISKNDFSPRIR